MIPLPFSSSLRKYNLYPPSISSTASTAKPSAGVSITAPPAALILSIINSKKCADPVTSKSFVLMVSLLVMLLLNKSVTVVFFNEVSPLTVRFSEILAEPLIVVFSNEVSPLTVRPPEMLSEPFKSSVPVIVVFFREVSPETLQLPSF